ncbi:response regulator transcription factor [Paenibacillus thalictri]|uniref:response regulator transcription factor n=1 Tax=Paenibacillus thalictri TaxID=2527873 RepID=UPI0013EF2ACD|nr:response regulator [Paenibacillus thalictri]
MQILIVEDEILVRQGIISGIEWAKHGIEIVGEAADGYSGLELVRTTKPDMVITDIKMPIMDGLEMIRHIRKELPDIKIMILSVREDFQSVQEALRLGVIDYVHKLTMSPEELLTAVLKIKSALTEPLTIPTDPPDPIVHEDDSMSEWLHGKTVPYWEQWITGNEWLLIGKIYVSSTSSASQLIKSMLHSKSASITRHMVMDKEDPSVYWILIKCMNRGIEPSIVHTALSSFLRKATGGGHSVSIGLSLPFQSSSEKSTAIHQAAAALEHKFYNGNGFVSIYTPRTLPQNNQPFITAISLKEYLVALETLEDDTALQKFHELFPSEADTSMGAQRIRDGIYRWQSTVLSLLNDWGGDMQDSLMNETPFDIITNLRTYPELLDWCLRLHTVVQEKLHHLKSVKHSSEIGKSISFIRDNFHKPLRVQDVAAEVNLSENYFSYMFTKCTGKTFVHFLHETRVEKAKELLRSCDSYWFTIGEQVGFENPKYFAKIFKRFTKLTPAQYKKSKVTI